MTTSNLYDIIPLNSLYLQEIMQMLDVNYYISYSELPCGVTNIWSGLSNSPFNPPQEFLFSENIPFSEILWALPNTTENNKIIYTYLLFDDNINITAEEMMRNFTFAIGPGLVDHMGRQVVGDGVIHPTIKGNISCDEKIVD